MYFTLIPFPHVIEVSHCELVYINTQVVESQNLTTDIVVNQPVDVHRLKSLPENVQEQIQADRTREDKPDKTALA